MTARYVTCRVLTRRGNQCTAEAVDPDAELEICTRHLAEAMRLVRDARETTAAATAAERH